MIATWEKEEYNGSLRWFPWYRGQFRRKDYVWRPDPNVDYWQRQLGGKSPPFYAYADRRRIGEFTSLAAAKRAVEKAARFRPDRECSASDWNNLWRPSKKELCTPQGQVRLKRIGKGAFSTAYRTVRKDQKPSSTVLIFTTGSDKEVMEMAYRYADDRARVGLPKVERYGTTQQNESVYKMPLYKKLTKDSPRAWADWQTLRKLAAGMSYREQGYTWNWKFLERAEGAMKAGDLTRETWEALQQVISTAADFGSQMQMEFAQRNLKVSPRGDRLKLLDPVFDPQELRRRRGFP